MIHHIDVLPPLPASVIGCQIQTLVGCYQNLKGFLSLYRSLQGGVLCQFENRLLICGEVDAVELHSFAKMTGVTVIEGLAPDLIGLDGYAFFEHTVLQHADAHLLAAEQAVEHPDDPKQVYELLCQTDVDFMAQTAYLPWLSDLRLRQRKGYAELFWIEGMSCACVSAKGCGLGLISQLATHKSLRRQGLAKKLLDHICAHLSAEALMPVILAQDEMLTGFYQQNGFTPCGRYIILKQNQEEHQT